MGNFDLEVKNSVHNGDELNLCSISEQDCWEVKIRDDERHPEKNTEVNRSSFCALSIPEKCHEQSKYNHDNDIFSKYTKDLRQNDNKLRICGLYDGAWKCDNELNPWEYATQRSKLLHQLNLVKSKNNCDMLTEDFLRKDSYRLGVPRSPSTSDVCECVRWCTLKTDYCMRCESTVGDNKLSYIDSKCVDSNVVGHSRTDVLDKNQQCQQQSKISKFLVVDPAQRITAKEALAHPFFRREEREDLITGQRQFFPRRAFKGAVMCVIAMHRIKHLHLNPPPISIEQVKRDPYSIKTFRKIIDAGAFRIYGHWVKKGENQNRAALFENVPKKDLKSTDSEFGGLFLGTSSVLDINVRSRVGRAPFKVGQAKDK